jgi:hypothetical protein
MARKQKKNETTKAAQVKKAKFKKSKKTPAPVSQTQKRLRVSGSRAGTPFSITPAIQTEEDEEDEEDEAHSKEFIEESPKASGTV